MSVAQMRVWRRADWEARRSVCIREEEGTTCENVPLIELRFSCWGARFGTAAW